MPERVMARTAGRSQSAAGVLAALAAALLIDAAIVGATPTPRAHPSKAAAPKAAAVTDANVADRVVAARTTADHNALAAYYSDKAKAEAPRIAHYEQLLRAYMQLEGKPSKPLQQQARMLLKGARMAQKHYDLLAEAHRTVGAQLDVHQ